MSADNSSKLTNLKKQCEEKRVAKEKKDLRYLQGHFNSINKRLRNWKTREQSRVFEISQCRFDCFTFTEIDGRLFRDSIGEFADSLRKEGFKVSCNYVETEYYARREYVKKDAHCVLYIHLY